MDCRVQMIAWHSRTNGQHSAVYSRTADFMEKSVNSILQWEIRSSDCINVRHILPHIFCNQFYFLLVHARHSNSDELTVPFAPVSFVYYFFPSNFSDIFHLPYCIVRIISKFRIGSLVGSTSNSSMTTEVTFLFESADSAFTAFMIFPWSETRERKRNVKMENDSMELKTSVFC